MADNTILNLGAAGDTYRSEDLGTGVKIAVSKLYTGAHAIDGGPVTAANPLPVSVQGTVALAAGAAAIGGVTVSNFPGTQAVSLATLPALTAGAAVIGAVTQSGTWTVSTSSATFGAAFPATGTAIGFKDSTGVNLVPGNLDASGNVKVSGAFWQATQPVSVGSSVAVTGTFYQATQPVSLSALPALSAGTAVIGHVIVDAAPSTAVTGTFFQATQPVSLATAPTTPVTGTFWQATQPVIIATGAAVIGSVSQNGTWTVTANAGSGTMAISAASLPLPTGAALDATVSTLSGKVTACNTGAVVVSTLPSTPAGTNLIGQVSSSLQINTVMNGITPVPILGAVVNFNGTGDQTIVAGVAAKSVYILSFYLQFAGASTLTVKDGVAGTAVTGAMSFVANQSFSKAASQYPHFVTSAANAFVLNCGSAVQVSGWVRYVQF